MLPDTKHIEKTVSASLKSLGYFNIKIEEEQENYILIIADGALRSIFLKVLIFTVSSHKELSSRDIEEIRSKASSFGRREPWSVIVNINDNGEISDSMRWKDLSYA